VEKHEFILFLWVGFPLELEQIKFSCELLSVKKGAVSITRLGAPEDLQLWLSILREAGKKRTSALIKNISTFPIFKRDIIHFFALT